jgi:hypothetical protein
MAKRVTFESKPKKPRKAAGSDNFFWDVMTKSERQWANRQARKGKRKASGGGS